MQKIKFTQLNELILNGDTYIPFKLHQLPSYYEEICASDIVSLKGYTYINVLALKSYNRNITTLNRNLDGQYSSSK